MTAKLYENEGDLIIELPKEYIFFEDEAEVCKVGDVVMLLPKRKKWAGFISSFDLFDEDFMNEGRCQSETRQRESLCKGLKKVIKAQI